MATVKKGTLTPVPSYCGWWKHLRPDGKRFYWKRERKAGQTNAKGNQAESGENGEAADPD
jgi:hypothetical protein